MKRRNLFERGVHVMPQRNHGRDDSDDDHALRNQRARRVRVFRGFLMPRERRAIREFLAEESADLGTSRSQ